jgi:2Fe-2S ferredoxin
MTAGGNSESTDSKAANNAGTGGKTVSFTFVEAKSGDKIKVNAPLGKSVLDIALDHDVDIEGACGGELACSTCHVILTKELFDSLPPKKEEEEDMLDLAWGLTDTSRLCCQIKVSDSLEGAEFTVPSETNNML